MFQKGGPGGPGRRPGSRNKIAASFFDALYADFQANGVEAIAAARVESPLGYLRMVASLLPQKLQVEAVTAGVSDDELVAIIRQAEDDSALSESDETGGRVH